MTSVIQTAIGAQPTVDTTQGRVRGSMEHGCSVFRGIPYAEPPAGALRFRPPARRRPWDGTRDATRFGPCHPQDDDGVEGRLMSQALRPPQGEDCLNLNVWTPDPGAAALPVLVWIHGGSLKYGCGADAVYDGATFARDGVVTVTLNYRLHPAGFLRVGDRPGSGAFGLLDQIGALEWVRENIAAFGGDPDMVTVAGESAGAHSVGQLLAAPAARGLFRRAILQSGAASWDVPVDAAAAIGDAVLRRLGVRHDDDDALAAISSSALLAASRAVEARMLDVLEGHGLRPNLMSATTRVTSLVTYGGDVVPQRALAAIAGGSARGIDLLVGTTLDETSLFGPAFAATAPQAADLAFGSAGRSGVAALDAYRDRGSEGDAGMRFLTDAMFRIPAIQLAEAALAHGARAYMYLLSYGSPPPSGDGRGAIHALDLPFMWNRIDDIADPIFELVGKEPSSRLAETMHGAWVEFVRTGAAQHPSLPGWPLYDRAERATMRLDEPCSVVSDPMDAQRRAWEGVRY